MTKENSYTRIDTHTKQLLKSTKTSLAGDAVTKLRMAETLCTLANAIVPGHTSLVDFEAGVITVKHERLPRFRIISHIVEDDSFMLETMLRAWADVIDITSMNEDKGGQDV